jgi:hypothetical protein
LLTIGLILGTSAENTQWLIVYVSSKVRNEVEGVMVLYGIERRRNCSHLSLPLSLFQVDEQVQLEIAKEISSF